MRSYLILIYVVVLTGCAPWKKQMVATGNQNDAIQNAIYDFLNTSRLNRKDSVFSVQSENINNEVLGVSIWGDINPVLVSTEDSVEFSYRGFPTRYIEIEGKLFYWDDSTKSVTDNLIATLTKYNRVDTTVVNVYIPERIIDHTRKGLHYYFCKNNLLIYKKIKTKKAMGHYVPPNLSCSE